MAARTTRYRSHSPTPSPVPEHPQPLTTTTTLASMTLDTRGSQDNLYGGRNDLTLPPFSRNMVIGTGAPHSPRHSNYTQNYPSKDAKNHPRSNRPTLIPENDIARERVHHYTYDDNSYSEFAQTKPSVNMQDSEPSAHSRQLPSLGTSQFANGSRSLPPPNPSTYQPNYSTSLDPHRQRQLSINSIISSPSVNNSGSANFNSFGGVAHGNGTMKKRKKSFGTENEVETENIDSDDREREGGQARNGDGGGSGANGNHKSLGVGLEDPDVRLAAEALGDLRADLNHSGISNHRRQNHLHLSTTSSSNSSATNTGVNSPLSPSQPSNQYATTNLNPENAPLLDLIQNNPNPVLRAASAAGRFSAAAYSTSKTLSPRFKYAAEHVESVAKGRLGDAVGGLVSTVGKRSGLEGFVRRSLATSAGTSLEGGESGKDSPENNQDNRRLPPITNGTAKKRKTRGEDMAGNGAMSSSTLDIPEERKALQKQSQQQDSQSQNWQTRLILSASGGVMSEESLKSLRYCLDWLRWANNHLGKCIETLKTVLEEYEGNNKSLGSARANSSQNQANGNSSSSSDDSAAVTRHNPEQTEERKQMLMGRIERLKGEVLKTLKKVITVVDSYAGGALVGETRNMVKRQLLHLPQRLQIALVAHTPESTTDGKDGNNNGSNGTSGPVVVDTNPTATAQRVIIVAKEGLDMMHNVSRLVEFALVSAEEWCEKFAAARRRDPEPEEKGANGNVNQNQVDSAGDVKMVEAGAGQESSSSSTPSPGEAEKRQRLTENGDRESEKRDLEGDIKMES